MENLMQGSREEMDIKKYFKTFFVKIFQNQHWKQMTKFDTLLNTNR